MGICGKLTGMAEDLTPGPFEKKEQRGALGGKELCRITNHLASSSALSGMLMKMTLGSHLTPDGMTIIKKANDSECCGGYRERRAPSAGA